MTDDQVPPTVSVVVPNWNGVRHLPECLDDLYQQTIADFEIIVVDNASTDESVVWLQENAPRVKVVRREVNGGVPACINSGIRAAGGDYVAVLMNDTVAAPDWLQSLVGAVHGTGYDCAASRMVFFDEPGTVNAAGDVFNMYGLIGRQRGRGMPAADYLTPVRVLGACGGAALYRRRFFEDVGLFDEDFFMVHEDTDINLRALIAGKRCIYVPTAVIRHKDSATVRAVSDLSEHVVRNQFRVVAKDLPVVLFPVIAVMWVYSTFRAAVPLRPASWRRIPGLLAGLPHRIALQIEGARRGWRKRADVWARREVSTLEIVRWLFRGVGPA